MTTALEGGEGSASRPGRFLPRERPGTHCTGGWVGHRAGLERAENISPTGIRSPDHPARSQSLYRLSYRSHRDVWRDVSFRCSNHNLFRNYFLISIMLLYLKWPFFSCLLQLQGQYKGKAVPLQVWSGPQGSRKLRFPDFMTTAQESGKVVSLTHRPHLPPGNPPGTLFC